jgi:hypothetical protein
MEADISILRKTGHFYFALTRTETNRDEQRANRERTESGCGVHQPDTECR